MRQAEFRDRRLVAVYDAENPWSTDDDLWVSLLADPPAQRVLDLGCGTGRLALGLARAGHRVTGVDPAAASLAAARAKPGAEAVTWVEGTSSRLPVAAFDAAVMTSHVAQVFVDEGEWRSVLADLHRALVPGGLLAFDSRDPGDRRWERWNPQETRRRTVLPDGDAVVVWTEVTHLDVHEVDGGPADEFEAVVGFTHHYGFDAVVGPIGHGGAEADRPTEDLASTLTLRFRTEAQLRASVAGAGFAVEHVWGGWDRQPVGHPDGELLVVARRR